MITGHDLGNILGWVERDGIEGASNESEIVHTGDEIESGVILHINCHDCQCTNGGLTCTENQCTGCYYSNWATWSLCSKSCDNGNRIRTRKMEKGKGKESCNLPIEESFDCNFMPCESGHFWNTWSQWSTCSANCGKGQQERKRECSNGIDKSNKCAGTAIQIHSCIIQNCTTQECTGGMVWSNCSNGCHQTCTELKLGEEICQESDNCIPGCKCPTGLYEQKGECIPKSSCYCYDKTGNIVFENFETTVQDECEVCKCSSVTRDIVCSNISSNCCPYSEWTDWGSCSKTCGAGVKNRYKKRKVENSCGKEYIAESLPCTLGICLYACIIDNVGYHHGDIIREDICNICYCEGFNETCYNQPATKIDGNWGTWTDWSVCSDSCQPGGFRQRHRSCSNPLPRCNGSECAGNSVESESCNEDIKCCKYGVWSFWSSCSSSCGSGQQTRERKILNTTFCKDDVETDKKACNLEPCGENCGAWDNWSSCEGDCTKGITTRLYHLFNNQKNNSACKSFTEEKECNLDTDCTCSDGEEFTSTADCEATCGYGLHAPSTLDCETTKYGCKCKDGLYRNKNGSCIPKEDCILYCEVENSIKMDKETWTDPADNCSICECIGGDVECQRICEIPVCSRDEELFYPEINPCCPICKSKSENKCQKKSTFEFLKNETSQCISVEKVQISYCSGHCSESSSRAVLLSLKPDTITEDMFSNNCECCQAKAIKLREVTVICGPEQTETTMYYPEVCSCECSKCA